MAYELYRHPVQVDGGYVPHKTLDLHLCETGLSWRTLSAYSKIVEGWIADPSTYPEELKGCYPLLWQGYRIPGGRYVRYRYLSWSNGKVEVVSHVPRENEALSDRYPILLAPADES